MSALERRYIQLNPTHLRWFLIFDVDREGAAFSWEDAGLPHPTWIATNPKNTHAHLVYTLDAPVLTSDFGGRQAPLRYLAAIEEAYRCVLGADDGYSNLITKNPMNLDWYVLRAGNNCLRGESLDYNAIGRGIPPIIKKLQQSNREINSSIELSNLFENDVLEAMKLRANRPQELLHINAVLRVLLETMPTT